ncbi:nitric oxide reductase activation-like protein [Romboutsia maritimum]|uniref:Nitric oxide reductase activation-like protein n=1 Tax=Romboutsia maritimum TaxID=2020948 RepID=A0A371IUB5_9FIRM|nr:nitric oxide reductase activation-like protein [Romboutsia maritimum]RDY24063.1 nitric oxide reductase activation-like protein [Romboutsia maritimum]
MKWIYNEYEFDNRVNNLSWTISGKYNEDIDILEKDYSSKDVSLYFAIISGARRKYVDWDMVKKYLVNRINHGYDKETILNLVQITLNNIVESKVIQDRPGVEDIRQKAYKDIVSNFNKIYENEILEKVKYAFILESMGKHPALSGLNRRIVNDIKDININYNMLEVLKGIDEIYLNYFEKIINKSENNIDINYKNSKEIDFDTFSNFMYEELYSEEEEKLVENEINEISSSMLVESIGEINKANLKNSSNRVIYVDEETSNKIYEKIEYYYGKAFLSKSEIKKIETKNCRNVHEGCRVHFTDGVLRSECKNIFQVKYVTRQKENNISKYRDNIKIHKRNINKLKESLLRILIQESSKSRVYSDCGNICANRAWRASRSNNNKIFYKDIDNEKGRYVIDILLDASGSQSRNQAMVATQAYIIATALTLVGIPNRVIGFSSFLDYTILRRFKDYNDEVKKSENIFEYFCAGNNRDGLAIKSVCENLISRDEENKILIVLSDGKPNDIKIGKDTQRSIRGEMSYRGNIAIKDTANEVRRARQRGILVLGVFTGKENELEAERLIYGNDFIYTKNIDRFSDIVSMYLKKIIIN